jgi:hypothetical protein
MPPKPKPKESKKAQYERFKETARELGVDDPISASYEGTATRETAYASTNRSPRASRTLCSPTVRNGSDAGVVQW